MKYGVVLPSYIYAEFRIDSTNYGMASLAETRNDENKPTLLFVLRPTHYTARVNYELPGIKQEFNVETVIDPEGVSGTEQTLAWGTQKLFDDGCDYVTWMGDDALFHPQWHMKLRELINAKPTAKGWSVYRSAYEQYHKTLGQENGYVLVSTLCGHGMTISKEEWKEWGIDWRQGVWALPGSDTLDLYHATQRPGERWTTAESWIEHTGRAGVHCSPSTPEWAVNFQKI